MLQRAFFIPLILGILLLGCSSKYTVEEEIMKAEIVQINPPNSARVLSIIVRKSDLTYGKTYVFDIPLTCDQDALHIGDQGTAVVKYRRYTDGSRAMEHFYVTIGETCTFVYNY